jgi:hypothetical protein
MKAIQLQVFLLIVFMTMSGSIEPRIVAVAQSPSAKRQTASQLQDEDPIGSFPAETYNVKETDDAETRLLKEQVRCLQAECESLEIQYKEGNVSYDSLGDAWRRLADARLEFHVEPEVRRQILTEQLEVARAQESLVKQRLEFGDSSQSEYYRATSFRINAELELLRFEKAQTQKFERQEIPSETMEKRIVPLEVGATICNPRVFETRTGHIEAQRRQRLNWHILRNSSEVLRGR